MSVVTTWRSDVYHLLHMCHVYSELRIKVQHQSIWHITPALHLHFSFLFSIYLFIFENYLYHSVMQFQLQMIFVTEWCMNMVMCNDYWALLNQVVDDAVSVKADVFEVLREVHWISWICVVLCHHRQFCRLFLLLLCWAQQSYLFGSMHLSGHPVTTAVLQTALADSLRMTLAVCFCCAQIKWTEDSSRL
jgi:hypothetical protein